MAPANDQIQILAAADESQALIEPIGRALLQELDGVRSFGEVRRLADRAIAGDELDVLVRGLCNRRLWRSDRCSGRFLSGSEPAAGALP